MKDWFTTTPANILAILLTTLGIYIALVLLTRLSGKRSFSKMSSFDFAMTVAIGSVIATVIISKSVSFQNGVAGLIFLYALQMVVAYARRWKMVRSLIDNKPTLLMRNGNIIEGSLKKCNVTQSDLKAKLREANVIQLSEVKAVVFESTGDISVLHGSDNKKVDEWLLDF